MAIRVHLSALEHGQVGSKQADQTEYEFINILQLCWKVSKILYFIVCTYLLIIYSKILSKTCEEEKIKKISLKEQLTELQSYDDAEVTNQYEMLNACQDFVTKPHFYLQSQPS